MKVTGKKHKIRFGNTLTAKPQKNMTDKKIRQEIRVKADFQ